MNQTLNVNNLSFTIPSEKLVAENERIFEDALEEFYSLEVIVQRFDEWRQREKDSYNNAYVDLFLPRLCGCIVRWHLLQSSWNPLDHELTLITKSVWFQTLAHYDMHSQIQENNPDPLVISKTLEIAVVPYVLEVMTLTKVVK